MATYKGREIDKSALIKTLGLFILSIMFVVTYAADMEVCVVMSAAAGDTAESMSCRMSLYTIESQTFTGTVLVIYYLLTWVGICVMAAFGFVLLICNCGMKCRRIYAFSLFGAAGALGFAEVTTMIATHVWAVDNFGTGYANYAAAFGGLNACVFVMETYVLLNTGLDAWIDG